MEFEQDFTDNVLSDQRVSYFGNVRLDRDISINDLQSLFDTIVLSYGANSDNKLGIEGEELKGIYSSRKFVNWYNGHPFFVDAITDDDFTQNKSNNVIIIGQGNVAIDCARILASNIDKLSKTDITNHALQKLSKYENNIKNIYMIGRRGAVQSSFTNKELREVISDMNDDCISTINKDEMSISTSNEASKKEMEARAVGRKISIFERASFDDDVDITNNDDKKFVHFRFLLSPKKFIGDDNGRVKSVLFEKNELYGDANQQKVKGTKEFIEIEAGLVLTSIGYKALSIDESMIKSNWNSEKNVVKNENGKVTDNGIYCAGWVKRGATGIIGTNIPDAQQTVASIIKDYESNKFENNNVISVESDVKFKNLLDEKNILYVDKDGWNNIDQYEKEIGSKDGKPREKMLNIEEMIKVSKGF